MTDLLTVGVAALVVLAANSTIRTVWTIYRDSRETAILARFSVRGKER